MAPPDDERYDELLTAEQEAMVEEQQRTVVLHSTGVELTAKHPLGTLPPPPLMGGPYELTKDDVPPGGQPVVATDEDAMVGAPHPLVLPPGRPFASADDERYIGAGTYTSPSQRGAERHRQARVADGADALPRGVAARHPYDLDNIFTYHPPIGDQSRRYGELRDSAKAHAALILKLCPPSAERTLALRRLEECVMWSNAAIARNEGPPEVEAP